MCRSTASPHGLGQGSTIAVGGRVLKDWAPLMAAGIVLIGTLIAAGITVRQKWKTDQRDAWWKRAQWAIDKSLSAEPNERDIGNLTIQILVQDEKGLSTSDIRVIKEAALRSYMDVR
jgi:hypothetical protein